MKEGLSNAIDEAGRQTFVVEVEIIEFGGISAAFFGRNLERLVPNGDCLREIAGIHSYRVDIPGD